MRWITDCGEFLFHLRLQFFFRFEKSIVTCTFESADHGSGLFCKRPLFSLIRLFDPPSLRSIHTVILTGTRMIFLLPHRRILICLQLIEFSWIVLLENVGLCRITREQQEVFTL